jgi:hypothetical protein
MLTMTYSDAGVCVYMEYANRDFKGARPIQLCMTPEGRQQVYNKAVELTGGM